MQDFIIGEGVSTAKWFCLYLNAPGSFSCNSIWVDTLNLCNKGTSKTYLIL